MAKQAEKKKVSALVLQGGGALGAYEYGVLKALFNEGKFTPEIICGVSIGAFSAATIAGAKDGPLNGLEELWRMFTAENIPFMPHSMQVMATIPFNTGMYYPSMRALFAPMNSTHMFDTAPLHKTLNQIIDFKKLNSEDAPHVVIGATNIETGLGELFDNRNIELTTKHIVASGSLPPSFPIVEINGKHYWDGGLFSNTPLKPAIKALEAYGDDYEKELVVIELFPNAADVPENMPDVVERTLGLILENKLVSDKKLFQQTSESVDLMERLEEELPMDSPIRDYPAFKRLASYSKVDKLTVIRYEGDETVFGMADFTEQTINRRIELGYQDGLKHLKAQTSEQIDSLA